MKIVKWIAIVSIAGVTFVALAGMYKFNYLASLEGYDVDGNKITSQESDYFYDTEYFDNEPGYIVEEEVDGPEDCTELEKYDQERGVCFFECDSLEQCDEIDQKIDSALEELTVRIILLMKVV